MIEARFLELNDSAFEKFEFPKTVVEAAACCKELWIRAKVQHAWQLWTAEIGSREARGESFFTALFDAAPSLQIMFKNPKAVTAMRFMEGLGSLIAVIGKPNQLFKEIESLGFRHLDIDVTSPFAATFNQSES